MLPDKEVTATYNDTASSLGITISQLIGDEDIPKADLAWKFARGQPLVRPEQVRHLPTQMRRLHEWYMQSCRESQIMLVAAVRDEHYFRGDDKIHVEFEELFQLYNQDTLDKTIISCYCL